MELLVSWRFRTSSRALLLPETLFLKSAICFWTSDFFLDAFFWLRVRIWLTSWAP